METSPAKLKILYLITKSNFGGAQRYVYDLATSTKKRGHDVTVGFGGQGILSEKLTDAGIRTISIPELERDMNFVSDLKSFMGLLKLLKEERPDVVHLNSSKIGGLGALAGRLHNIARYVRRGEQNPLRIVFTGHGWAFTEERPDWERALIAGGHWLTIQLAHDTIAVSKRTREEVARIPFTWHKMTVIHNGTNNIPVRSRKAALLELLGKEQAKNIPAEALIIGTIGELHKNKGHIYALEALAALKRQSKIPFRFIIIGEGEERARLETLRTQLGLEEEVLLPGFGNGVRLLSAFDIFLFPSVKEGFPYAILEAGNVGLPVIATHVGGIPEVIDDMQSGILIQSKNPGEITRALSHLFENPERRAQLGSALAERIVGRFNVDAMVDKTLALYTKNSQK